MKEFIMGMLATVMILATIAGATAYINNNGDGTWTFGYTLSTADAIELRDALCHNGDYSTTIINYETLELEPNPETCEEFAWKRGKKFFSQELQAYRQWVAEQQITTPAEATIE